MTQHRAAPSEHRWMISYVDVLTILLIFFVAAAVNHPKPLTAPVVEVPKPQPPKIPDPMERVEQALAGEKLEVKPTSRGLSITLPQEILFAPGDDKIRKDALPTLAKISAALGVVPNQIALSGHADTTPIHNSRFRSNWDLAAARSLRLLEELTGRFEMDESRFSVESYGASAPRSSNDTAEGRANNRRVEILLLN